VVEGDPYEKEKDLADRLAKSGAFEGWQVIVILDDAGLALSSEKLLWATWTRFNPATDLYSANTALTNNHVSYSAPIVIDSRMKPWFPKEVEPRDDIVKLVDSRWSEYFSTR
jgi:hypothetical protein